MVTSSHTNIDLSVAILYCKYNFQIRPSLTETHSCLLW